MSGAMKRLSDAGPGAGSNWQQLYEGAGGEGAEWIVRRRYLALDVGGTKVKGGVVSEQGRVLAVNEVASHERCSLDELLADIDASLRPLLRAGHSCGSYLAEDPFVVGIYSCRDILLSHPTGCHLTLTARHSQH